PGVSFPVMLAQQFAGQAVRRKDSNSFLFAGEQFRYFDPTLRTVLIGTWPQEDLVHVSALNVLRGSDTFHGRLKDKIVIVGQSNDAARDQFLTPLFRVVRHQGPRRLLPGTLIHGAAIETLLHGKGIRTVPIAVTWSWDFLFAALTAFVLQRISSRFTFPAVFA